MKPERLYGPADMARALGVSPSAVSNYLRRSSFTFPPAPFIGPKGSPLWRADDVALVAAARLASIEAFTETLERGN